MLHLRPLLFAFVPVLLATSLCAGRARADDDPDAAKADQPSSHDDLLVTAAAGALAEEHNSGGTLALTVLRQHGWLGYGATFEYSGAVFDYTSVTAAPMIGVFVDGPRWARAGLAATAGLHSYSGVGSGLLSSDPGAAGNTGFVGARMLLGVEMGGSARFHLGLQLSVDDDLARTRKTYSFQESSWFGGGTYTETSTQTIGALRFGALVALGGAFDL